MNSHPALDKIEMIERSLRCFACGLLGLLPFIGIPFAVVAIRDFLRLFLCKEPWNPAGRYLRVGGACATAGILLNLLLVAAIVLQVS